MIISSFCKRWSIFLICYLICSTTYAANLDSLLAQLEKNIPDTTRVKVLASLVEADDIHQDDAEKHAWQALQIAEDIGYTFGVGLSKYQLMSLARSDAEIEKLFNETLNIFERLNNDHYIAKTYLQAAAAYLSNGYLVRSMKFSQKYLSTPYTGIDSILTARAWNLIGEVYRISGNYESALEIYMQSTNYAKGVYISPYINIGTVYMGMGKYDKALATYDSMLMAIKQKNDTVRNAYGYLLYRKAQLLIKENKLQEAEKMALKSLRIYGTLKYKIGNALPMNALCEIYYKQGRREESITIGVKALEIATSMRYYNEQADKSAKIVAQSFRDRGDFENADHYEQVRGEIRNKIFNPKITAELTNEQIKLETQKQALEKQLLEEQQERAQAMLKKQRLINGFAIGALALLAIISFLLYRHMRVKHKLNARLIENQQEIMAQAAELRSYNLKIKEINSNLEAMVEERTNEIKKQNLKLMEYAYFNAHQIRGPLARILGLINLMTRDFPNDPYDKYKQMMAEAGQDLDAAVNEIKQVLEQDEYLSVGGSDDDAVNN